MSDEAETTEQGPIYGPIESSNAKPHKRQRVEGLLVSINDYVKEEHGPIVIDAHMKNSKGYILLARFHTPDNVVYGQIGTFSAFAYYLSENPDNTEDYQGLAKIIQSWKQPKGGPPAILDGLSRIFLGENWDTEFRNPQQ